jgi:GNAT superfamily N-acetyltransferase
VIIDINDQLGNIKSHDWLMKAEVVHRQLRPFLPKDYLTKMQRVFSGGGRMCVFVEGYHVTGVAVYRVYEDTANGQHMYVDDLISDEAKRSTGIGKALMRHLQNVARELRCEKFTLDSGTHRQQAHKFYFREGMVVTAFHFGKVVPSGVPSAEM